MNLFNTKHLHRLWGRNQLVCSVIGCYSVALLNMPSQRKRVEDVNNHAYQTGEKIVQQFGEMHPNLISQIWNRFGKP